ncbi:flagellar protein FlgN [Thalassobacillus sp. C254]|uniref:flagellar protein FlgN n=1 Tax=Thalassobacillus sp. C254 TaxID=1225341 RepID=UPI0006CF2FC8|nr:flagellar protein FlgN [Thalassobacillus sp. C254]
MKEIFESLADLVKVHQQMNDIAIQKTEVIKVNDIKGLQTVIQQETKLLKALQLAEGKRQKAVSAFLTDHPDFVKEGGEGSMNDLFSAIPQDYQKPLQTLYVGLLKEVDKLSAQNELNQQMIRDSLQFVNLSLDLLQPDQETFSYQNPHEKGQDRQLNYSAFDSRA